MRTVEVHHELTGASDSPVLVLAGPLGTTLEAASIRWMGTSGIAHDVVSGWFTPDWAAAHPEFVEQAIKMISNTPDDGYAECCSAIAGWTAVPRIRVRRQPTCQDSCRQHLPGRAGSLRRRASGDLRATRPGQPSDRQACRRRTMMGDVAAICCRTPTAPTGPANPQSHRTV